MGSLSVGGGEEDPSLTLPITCINLLRKNIIDKDEMRLSEEFANVSLVGGWVGMRVLSWVFERI